MRKREGSEKSEEVKERANGKTRMHPLYMPVGMNAFRNLPVVIVIVLSFCSFSPSLSFGSTGNGRVAWLLLQTAIDKGEQNRAQKRCNHLFFSYFPNEKQIHTPILSMNHDN